MATRPTAGVVDPAMHDGERAAVHLLPASAGSLAPAGAGPVSAAPAPWASAHLGSARAALDLAAAMLAAMLAVSDPGSASVLGGVGASAYPLVVLGALHFHAAAWEDGSLLDELRRLVVVTSLAALALMGAITLIARPAPAWFGVRMWVFTLLLLATARIVLRRTLQSAELVALRRTLIVGAGAVGVELAQRLEREPAHGLRPIGFLDRAPQARDRQAAPHDDHLPLLGTPDELADAAAGCGAECVAFAFLDMPDRSLLPLVEQCQRLGLGVFVVPRLYEAVTWRMRMLQVESLPLGELRWDDPRGARFAVKYLVDRVGASLLLVVLAPMMLGIAVLVKASSPGPVLYRQRRVARDGRQFTMLKFRTMRTGSPEARKFPPPPGCAPGGIEHGDRRTRIGIWLRRSSLDELPQLVNVLRGEMSLIGPRPERPEYVIEFDRDVPRYAKRHRVKAGITGLAQVSDLRGQTSIAERALHDNFYVQNWSFWLDFKIALRTVGTVLTLRGE